MIFYKKIILSTTVVMLLVLPISCKKWLEVNREANIVAASSVTPDMVLPGVLTKTANVNASSFPLFEFLNSWMGYWCASVNGFQYAEEQSYNITTTYLPLNLFASVYLDIASYDFIERTGALHNQTFYQGIGKVMKALNFIRLTDIWNNVPYSESLNPALFLKPKYDDGQTIYEGCMVELDKAIELIKEADINKNENLVAADILFRGEKLKWIRFINTLKLRLLVHQANLSERTSYIQAEMTKIQSEGSGFLGTSETAALNPGFTSESDSKMNLYYKSYGFRFNGTETNTVFRYRANIIAMNFLKADDDPRLSLFYQAIENNVPTGGAEPFIQPPPSNFRGHQYGLQASASQYPYQASKYLSRIGGINTHGPVTPNSKGILKGYDMGMWIITSVESLFLQAEAIHRGWMSGDAKMSYMNAVKESFRWLNAGGNIDDISLSDEIFTNWYAIQDANNNQSVSWDDATDKYKLLMYQKYMAFNGIEPLEAWTDYRRNNQYPAIPLSSHPGRTSTKLPIRYIYPIAEFTNNRENVEVQGITDVFTGKIWWMP